MLSSLFERKSKLVDKEHALPGRKNALPVAAAHTVLKSPLAPPWPAGMQELVVGLGCFWGAERKFWQAPGVYSTSVGYAGGFTENPTYEEVCSGRTGHAEVVRVVFDPTKTSTATLVRLFFELHDPTQGMRQGNDVGTQYRSALYWNTPEQGQEIQSIKSAYDAALKDKGFGPVTTELRSMSEVGAYYYAEDYHQQYLDKNPQGYCGIGGTGVSCPT
jgi:peptide-methionine (S)-S-oxide reductase